MVERTVIANSVFWYDADGDEHCVHNVEVSFDSEKPVAFPNRPDLNQQSDFREMLKAVEHSLNSRFKEFENKTCGTIAERLEALIYNLGRRFGEMARDQRSEIDRLRDEIAALRGDPPGRANGGIIRRSAPPVKETPS